MENFKKSWLDICDIMNNVHKLSNLNKSDLLAVVRSSMLPLLKSKYGKDAEFLITVNYGGVLEITRVYEVVSPDARINPMNQISINDDRMKDELDFEVGDEYMEKVDLTEFTPGEILKLRSKLNNLLITETLEFINKKYEGLIGTIVNMKVIGTTKNSYVLTDNTIKFELPYRNTLSTDLIKEGSDILVLINEVGSINTVTRKSKEFMIKLLELKSMGVLDYELVDFKRKLGIRTKYVIKGDFDKSIYDSLKLVSSDVSEEVGEPVDIIIYSSDKEKYLRNCFFNAWIIDAWVSDSTYYLLADKSQFPFILGRRGINIQLSSDLLGSKIKVIESTMDPELDIELSEYKDADNKNLIDYLRKKYGVNTARELMKINRSKLPRDLKPELTKLMDLIHSDFTE